MANLDFIEDFPQLLTYQNQVVTVGQYWIKDFVALIQEIDQTYPDWQHLRVYAHQVDLAFNGAPQFSIDLTNRSSFRLFTRLFTSTGGGRCYFSSFDAFAGKQLQLCVQAIQTEQPLRVAVASSDTQLTTVDLAVRDHGNALEYAVALSETPTVASLALPSDWAVDDAHYWVLNQTFQEAFNTFSTDPDQAAAMFRWVAFCTGGVGWGNDPAGEMRDLGLYATSMAERAARPATVHYVPKLDMATYRQGVQDAVKDAAPVELAFNAFIEQTNSFAERQKQAALFKSAVAGQLINLTSQQKAAGSQLKQAEQDLQNNTYLLQDQQQVMLEAQEKLKIAVEEKAVKDFFTAVFSLVGGLGTALAGDPATAAGAVSEAEQVVATASKVTNLMTTLKKVIAALKNVADFALACDKIVKQVNGVGEAESGADVSTQPANGTDWLDDTQWQVLREQWDGEIRPYIDEVGLKEAASDYMTAGRIFVLYGQAVTASRLTISQLNGELAQFQVQQRTLQTQSAAIDAYVQAEQDDAQQYYQVASLLRQRYFFLKRFLLVQISDLREAFTYWSLSSLADEANDLTRLGYGSSLSEMSGVLVSLDGIMQQALSDFPGAPQGMKYQVVYPLADAERTSLATGKALALALNPLDPAFGGYDRLRVQYVRVLFPGLAPANNHKTYYTIVEDNGVYHDRLSHQVWAFQAENPMQKGYSAGVADAQKLLDAETDLGCNYAHSYAVSAQTGSDLSSGAFYTPSLFTTWLISLPPDNGDNDTLDWSAVPAVVLQLFGTAIFDQQDLLS